MFYSWATFVAYRRFRCHLHVYAKTCGELCEVRFLLEHELSAFYRIAVCRKDAEELLVVEVRQNLFHVVLV